MSIECSLMTSLMTGIGCFPIYLGGVRISIFLKNIVTGTRMLIQKVVAQVKSYCAQV